jgi:hypothetical protein
MKMEAEKPLKQWYPPARIHGVTSQITSHKSILEITDAISKTVLSSAVSFIYPQEQNVITCQQ